MGSQVSQRQKKDLAKYYTSLLGSKEQSSVNAYMQVQGESGTSSAAGAGAAAQRKRKRFKKKRAVSHGLHGKQRGAESQKNLLTIEQDLAEGAPRLNNDYGLGENEDGEGDANEGIIVDDDGVEIQELDRDQQDYQDSQVAGSTDDGQRHAQAQAQAQAQQYQQRLNKTETQSDIPNDGN